jgi:hypothetical protein
MWVVTEREAAAMYARACLSWYGCHRAKSVAQSMARKLSKAGDLKGVKAWRLVLEELVRLEREQRIVQRDPANTQDIQRELPASRARAG